MHLRDYQDDTATGVEDAFTKNRSTLVLLPTGCGKTVTFAYIVHRRCQATGKRGLIMAHREELIWQGANKIFDITGERPEVEMGDSHAQRHGLLSNSDVVVASVQTLNAGRDCKQCYAKHPDHDDAPLDPPCPCICTDGVMRRMAKFDPMDFCILVIDEAHHATASTYRRVVDYFMEGNPDLVLLGVTATSDRADESALGQIFDSVAYSMDILDAIDGGWLVPILQQWVVIESIDLSWIKTTAGDLNEKQLEEELTKDENLWGIAQATFEYSEDRPTLVFAATVAHAQKISDILNSRRPGKSICIHGKTPPDERRRLLAEYALGEYQYLCGCGVFLEGFDEPRISCVAMARPTKSRTLYAQAVGRGTRPVAPPGELTPQARVAGIANSHKPNMLVLDFVGNSGKHKLISTADILGGRYDDEVVEAAKCKAKGKPGNQDLKAQLEESDDNLREHRKRVHAGVKAKLVSISPFDAFDVNLGREPGWQKGKAPTPNQIRAIEAMGVSVKESLTGWQATKILQGAAKRRNEGLSSFKQIKTLGKFGVDAKEMGFQHASQMLDAIAKNGWRVPQGLGLMNPI